MRVPLAVAGAVALASCCNALKQTNVTVDVLVVAANPGGIASAIAAANGGKHSVLIMEELNMIGGMGAAGGVGLMNQGAGNDGCTGLGRVWGQLNAARYPGGPPLNLFPDMWVAADSFWTMVNATDSITTRLGCRLVGAGRGAGACIASADFLCSGDTEAVTVTATYFIDASYDGSLMVAAGGIDYAWGREGAAEFNESLAGVQLQNETNESFEQQNLTVAATLPDGSLVPGISAEPLPPIGTADDRLMAFSYFACVTNDAGNSVPYPQPEGYNESDYVLLQRQIDGVIANGRYPQGPDLQYFSEYHYYQSNGTKLLLCCGVGPVNCDQPDLNRGWANATYEQKQAIAAAHKRYLLGSLYYMANSPNVPNYTRYAVGRWGLCKDEYVQNDNWPPQLYVRVSNRLRGEYLLTQNNIANPRNKPDGVAVNVWEFDMHTTSRRAVPAPKAVGEGGSAAAAASGGGLVALNEGYMRYSLTAPFLACDHPSNPCSTDSNWYDVPFGVMLPQRGQASNLLVPVAISATSVAYSSARIEQMYSDLGTAAGVAVAQALEAGPAPPPPGSCPAFALQDTNVTAVQQTLVSVYKQRIHGPVNATNIPQ